MLSNLAKKYSFNSIPEFLGQNKKGILTIHLLVICKYSVCKTAVFHFCEEHSSVHFILNSFLHHSMFDRIHHLKC